MSGLRGRTTARRRMRVAAVEPATGDNMIRLTRGVASAAVAEQGVHALQVEVVPWSKLSEVVGCGGNIVKGARPASSIIADAPVLDAPGGKSQRGKCSTGMAYVLQIVSRSPEASMYNNHDRDIGFVSG